MINDVPFTQFWIFLFISGWSLFRFICFQTVWHYFYLLQKFGCKVCLCSLVFSFFLLKMLQNWYSLFLVVEICSSLLDSSFLFSIENGEKFSVQPMRFTALLKMTRVKVRIYLHRVWLQSVSSICQCCRLLALVWACVLFLVCLLMSYFSLFLCLSAISSYYYAFKEQKYCKFSVLLFQIMSNCFSVYLKWKIKSWCRCSLPSLQNIENLVRITINGPRK